MKDTQIKSVSVLGMKTNLLSIDEVMLQVENMKNGYVCISNVHMCMEVFDDPKYSVVVNTANIVVPDGRPIYWAQKLLGNIAASQVRGQDLMLGLCNRARTNGLKVGLYGGSSQELVESVSTILKCNYPGLLIPYIYSPPFRLLTAEEDAKVVQDINIAEVDILFVGLGCPKQEKWMFEHYGRINTAMLGVGAAYDFIAGSKKHAPRWMQQVGLEWLFRLLSEPKRLWKRYLKQNPRFIYYFLQQWLLKKDFTKEGPKNV